VSVDAIVEKHCESAPCTRSTDAFTLPGGVSDRSIEKIFSGKNQAGSITKDAVGFTLKIKAGMLTVDKEPQIRALIAQLFTAGSNDGGQPLAISIDLATSIDFSCAGRKTFRNFDISGEIQPKIVPVAMGDQS
jgi:hypothetical protein